MSAMKPKNPLKVVNELMDNEEKKTPLGDEQNLSVLSIIQQLNTILQKVQDTIASKEYVDTSLPSDDEETDEKTIKEENTKDTKDTIPITKGDVLDDYVKITRYGKNEKDEFSLETTQDVYVPAYIRRK